MNFLLRKFFMDLCLFLVLTELPSLVCCFRSMSKKVTGFESVKEWLISINMETYLELFKAANIDSLEKLAKLEEKELRDMGVKLIGHRNKLKKSIKSTRAQFQNPTLDEAT